MCRGNAWASATALSRGLLSLSLSPDLGTQAPCIWSDLTPPPGQPGVTSRCD